MTLRLLAVIGALALCGSAQAADYGMESAGGGTSCANPGVLGHIRGHFAFAERRTWHRGFVMEALENPRPSGHPWAEPGLIARDYCMADGVMTNGEVRVVYYAVEHGVGFAGIGWNVDFCVLGLDPWHVHDGSCRTAR